MLSVRLFQDCPEDQRLWTEYVFRQPQATVDHGWEWRQVLQGAFRFEPIYVGAFEGERLAGVLPLFQVPCLFGKTALVSIPFGNYGGICADGPAATGALLDEARRLMQARGCAHVCFYHKHPVDGAGLVRRDDKVRYSMPVDPSGGLGHAMACLKKMTRKKVNYGMKSGLVAGASRDTGPLYEIHLRRFRELGTPCFPRSYFDLVLKHFGERAILNYAYADNKPVAFKFDVMFRGSFLAIVAGQLAAYKRLNPNIILFRQSVADAVTHGFSEIDMGRSSRGSGPAHYKACMGFDETPLGYQYLLAEDAKLSFYTTSGLKFRLAGAVWRKMPLACTAALGPKLVRYFA